MYTIFERLEEHFGKENIVTLAVITDGSYISAKPPQWIPINSGVEIYVNSEENSNAGTIAIDKGLLYHIKPARSYYKASLVMDTFLVDHGADSITVIRSVGLIEKYQKKRFFLFIHLSEVDKIGHKYGENSREYMQALVQSDRLLGQLVTVLKNNELYARTLMYVTSDHGFDRNMKTHQDAPYIFLASNNNRVIRRGLRTDITPTIYDALGINFKKIAPAIDGKSLQQFYAVSRW